MLKVRVYLADINAPLRPLHETSDGAAGKDTNLPTEPPLYLPKRVLPPPVGNGHTSETKLTPWQGASIVWSKQPGPPARMAEPAEQPSRARLPARVNWEQNGLETTTRTLRPRAASSLYLGYSLPLSLQSALRMPPRPRESGLSHLMTRATAPMRATLPRGTSSFLGMMKTVSSVFIGTSCSNTVRLTSVQPAMEPPTEPYGLNLLQETGSAAVLGSTATPSRSDHLLSTVGPPAS